MGRSRAHGLPRQQSGGLCPSRSKSLKPLQKTSSDRGRCRPHASGNLEYGRASRKPSLSQNRAQETASGQQTTPSAQTGVPKPGEGAAASGAFALSYHLHEGRCPSKADHETRQRYGIIGIENLNLRGLLKNRGLSRAFSDAALGKLRSLLEAKVEQRGGQIIRVDRFFPSSKRCHCCGWKWELMTLNDRIFVCQNPSCPYYQFPQDRDHNAG